MHFRKLNAHGILSSLEKMNGDNTESSHIIFYISESELNCFINYNSDSSGDKATGDLNHFGRTLLNTNVILC